TSRRDTVVWVSDTVRSPGVSSNLLTCRQASGLTSRTVSYLLAGRQVITSGDRGPYERAYECPPGHPLPNPGSGPGTLHRAGLRGDLATGDRRTARRHQGRALLPLQEQGRDRLQLHGGPGRRRGRAGRLGADPAAYPGDPARGAAALRRGAVPQQPP